VKIKNRFQYVTKVRKNDFPAFLDLCEHYNIPVEDQDPTGLSPAKSPFKGPEPATPQRQRKLSLSSPPSRLRLVSPPALNKNMSFLERELLAIVILFTYL
jgi:hypothetical protein